MILSGDYIALLDPHEEFFRDSKGHSSPGQRLHLKEDFDYIQKYSDQFEPFKNLFGGKLDDPLSHGYFNGTIFRY